MDFTIEELSMEGWPSLYTFLYDGWIIRLSNGYGNRSNSVNPIYRSKKILEEKFHYCDELFSSYNLPVTYKLIGCEEHDYLEKKLEDMKFNKINETSVQVCDLSEKKDEDFKRSHGEGIIISNRFNESWTEAVIKFNGIEEKHIATFRKILDNIAGEKIVVQKEINGRVLGCGNGVIGRGYVGIFDVVVEKSWRGKGYGREIVETILFEAKKRGAEKSYLQVMLNNHAALSLYKKLGYKEMYQYWYRKKSASKTLNDNF